MIRYFFIFFLLSFLYSCNENNDQSNVSIDVSFSKYSNQKIFLYELSVKNITVNDSVITNELGDFLFKFHLDESGFFMIGPNQENTILLQIDPQAKIILHSDSSDLSFYKVEGSRGSSILYDFENFRRQQKEKIDSLGKVLLSSQHLENFQEIKRGTDVYFDVIVNKFQQYSKEVVDKNLDNLASLFILNQQVERIPLFNEMDDFSYFHKTDSALSLNYPKNKHVAEHAKRVKKIRLDIYDDFLASEKLSPGNKAPKVVMKDPDENLFSLHDLKGSKVLLYFWSAWDSKSRIIHKKLNNEYNDWKSKGIEIFGVSMIENEKVWKSAIEMDKIRWKQGSDLKGQFSPVFKKYNLNNHIPSFYFIDEKGKIIMKSDDIDEIIMKIQEQQNN